MLSREGWLFVGLLFVLSVIYFATAHNGDSGPRNDAELQAAVLSKRLEMEEAQRARGEVVMGSAQWHNQVAKENEEAVNKFYGELRIAADSVRAIRDSLQAEAVARAVVRQMKQKKRRDHPCVPGVSWVMISTSGAKTTIPCDEE